MKFSVLFFIAALGAIQFSSCKVEGCTNVGASNYDPDANFSDESCVFPGCTDPNAVNYDMEAVGDNGTCIYVSDIHFVLTRTLADTQYVHVYWERLYKGYLDATCSETDISCETNCQSVSLENLRPGEYYFGAVLRPGTDTLKGGYISIGSQKCLVVEID